MFSDASDVVGFCRVWGLVGGSCNVAIRCRCRFGRIRQTPTGISTETIRDAYHRVGFASADVPEGAKRSMHVANSCARAIANQPTGEDARLAYESQISPYTVREK